MGSIIKNVEWWAVRKSHGPALEGLKKAFSSFNGVSERWKW
jgi:hypothetical protein